MGRAPLVPRAGMVAAVPPLRERPLANMKDMGMGDMDMSGDSMAGMDHSGMAMGAESGAAAMEMPAGESMPGMEIPAGESMPGMEMPGAAAPAAGAMAGMDHGSMKMRDFSVAPQVDKNPGVQKIGRAHV